MYQSNELKTCQIKQHQDFLLDSFQENFLHRLSQKKEINYDELLYATLNAAGIENYDKNSLNLFHDWFANVYQIDFLEDKIKDISVNEIILGSDNVLQCLGTINSSQTLSLPKHVIELSFEVLCAKNHETWNYSKPFSSFYTTLFDCPVRISLIHHSCSAVNVSKIFIRKHNKVPLPLNSFNIEDNDINYYIDLVNKKENILVTGATGSGKTSFLKSLIKYIPESEHLVCIEDTYEIYPQTNNHTSLLAADLPHKSLKDYCAYAMRMSPERIVLGEIRSHEIIPFLLSLNTGHKGVMASTHANCAREGVERLALLYSMYASNGDVKYATVLDLLCKNIDYIVFMENKKVSEVIKLYGANEGNIMYETVFKLEK